MGMRQPTKKEIKELNSDDWSSDRNYEYFDKGEFTLGQIYEDHTAIQMRCKKCKADRLYEGTVKLVWQVPATRKDKRLRITGKRGS